ncbi:MAG: glycerol-3-phosphate 1-O-acyltransferase PlsY [Planctomycetota bacterium]
MPPLVEQFLGFLAAFLVGGIPFGFLVAKGRAGIDIREHGSGNIGATNVGRVLGLPYFFLVFVLDFLKGALPVLASIGIQESQRDASGMISANALYLPEVAALAAVLGHLFPIYLRFRGGKGVATTIGALLPLAPIPLICGLVTWCLLVLTTRMVSVGSIGFAIVFAVAHFLFVSAPFARESLGLTVLVLAAACLVIVRHRENISRILRGTESKVRLPWAK